nr:hypothetical protein [Clostridium puniceum]
MTRTTKPMKGQYIYARALQNRSYHNYRRFYNIIFVIVDDIYQEVTAAYIKNRKNSIMSDSEIIMLSLSGELMYIDSKKAWPGYCKKNLKELFLNFLQQN